MCIRDSTLALLTTGQPLEARCEITVEDPCGFGPLSTPRGPLITFDGAARRVGQHSVGGGAAVVWSSPDAVGERTE
eukprot:5512072-Alexandrium_andersonii.AAC.1